MRRVGQMQSHVHAGRPPAQLPAKLTPQHAAASTSMFQKKQVERVACQWQWPLLRLLSSVPSSGELVTAYEVGDSHFSVSKAPDIVGVLERPANLPVLTIAQLRKSVLGLFAYLLVSNKSATEKRPIHSRHLRPFGNSGRRDKPEWRRARSELQPVPGGRRNRGTARAVGSARQDQDHGLSQSRPSRSVLRSRHDRPCASDRHAGRHRAGAQQLTSRRGVSLNLEQQLTETVGVFARAGWADGTIEPWDFTDVDRTFSGGVDQRQKLGRARRHDRPRRRRRRDRRRAPGLFQYRRLGIIIGDGHYRIPASSKSSRPITVTP